jgi:hypothetical protein
MALDRILPKFSELPERRILDFLSLALEQQGQAAPGFQRIYEL